MKFLKPLLGALTCLHVQLTSASTYSPYDLVTPLSLDADLNYAGAGSTVLGRKYVKLTSDTPDKRGWIVSKAEGPLPENFVFTMDFRLDDGGKTLYGDGMALWFIEDTPQEGSMMGLNEYYKGISVIIDTYRNGKAGRTFPRLVLAHNDGTQPYDKDNDGLANELDGCALRGVHNNKRQDFSSVRVTYSRLLRAMHVEVNFRNKWETCAYANIDMGAVRKIAVSAATGELTESHIVKDLRLIDFESKAPPALAEALGHGLSTPSDKSEEKESGGRSHWLRNFFIVLVILGMIRGWMEFKKYRKKQEDIRYKLI